jgi:hypothetical protein
VEWDENTFMDRVKSLQFSIHRDPKRALLEYKCKSLPLHQPVCSFVSVFFFLHSGHNRKVYAVINNSKIGKSYSGG